MENKKLCALRYIFCSDDYLLKINRKYLQHDFYTDTITFDLSEKNGVFGEIYVSVDRIKDNAFLFNSSFRNEIHRVIFHSALHLCGYEDKNMNKKKLMTKKEEFYLKQYFTK